MRTIKSKRDFEQVFTRGRRFNHPLVRMIVCRSQGEGDVGRVAFAAPKRIGNAVVRNRSKRVLRETARACGFPCQGYDIILFATPKTKDATPQDMTAALNKLCRRAGIHG